MTENNHMKTMDDLLDNPFDLQEPLLPKEMQTVNNEASVSPKLIDRLSDEEREKAQQLAAQIPVGNYEAILTYGASAQGQLSKFSHQMLDHVQSKDIGPVGDVLKDLMNRLSEIDPDDLSEKKKSGLSRLFNKATRSIQEMMTKYQKLSTQIDRIGVQLEHSKRGLIEDVQMLDNLYEQNKTYFQALNVYIAAAELKRDEIANDIIPEMRRQAELSNDQMAFKK